MTKNNSTKRSCASEHKILIFLSLLFVAVIGSAWAYSIHLRNTILVTNSVTQIDTSPLVQIQKIRNIKDSLFANSRSYFLLGLSNLFDEQKKDKDSFAKALTAFEKQYNLPQISELIANINVSIQQEQDIFDQAVKHREAHTESKIVGQFYQAKTRPIGVSISQALDKIEDIQNAEVDKIRTQANTRASEASFVPNVLIPRSILYFIAALSILFLSLIVLILRLLNQRTLQIAERDRLYREAQKATQARDEIIAAIANDMKEPLDTIKDALETSGNTETITNSVINIENSLKNIYDQAKSDMGNIALRLDQLGIDVVLDDTRLMWQTYAKQRDVRLLFDSGNPHMLGFFDRERVIRVLSNLVGNAIKFSPKNGKVMVKVRSDQQFIYISVEDNGPGIPEDKLKTIFSTFWQAPATANSGAGIGLAIVKTIVEAHGGTVKAESRLGAGSTFTFSLPRRRPVGAQINRSSPTVRSAPRTVSDAPSTTTN